MEFRLFAFCVKRYDDIYWFFIFSRHQPSHLLPSSFPGGGIILRISILHKNERLPTAAFPVLSQLETFGQNTTLFMASFDV